MAEIYQLPENGNNNGGFGNIPFSIPIGGFGMGNGFGGGFGNGMNGVFDIFALALVASMFGGFGGNGWGGGFGNNNAAAGYIANQLNNDSGRELLMNAITSQGEAGRQATQNLATTLGQDFDLVHGAVQNVQNALQTLAIQQAVSVPQIINSIQSGNQSLSQQLCNCCCEMQRQVMAQGYENQIATLNQTNALQGTMNANGQRNIDAIADLKATMVQSFCDVKEREMQDKINTQSDIITQLRGQLDNDRQTAQLFAALNPLQQKVNEIAAKQPNTVPVEFPNLVAVSNTPNIGGNWGWNGWNNGFFGGNGWGNNIVF